MNRGQLRAEVELRLRIPPAGDPLLDEAIINDCIRAALIDLSAVADWPWLLSSLSLTFTAGVAPIPVGVVKEHALIVNSKQAQYVDNDEFFDAQALLSKFVWTTLGSNIVLTPVPTVSPTNTLWFIQGEPALTLDTSSPLVPEAYQQVLIARACYHAEVRRSRAESAAFHNAEWERGRTDLREATRRRTGPRQIRAAGTRYWASW